MNLLGILNPRAGSGGRAGRGASLRRLRTLAREASRGPHCVEWRLTADPEEMRDALRGAPALGVEGALLAGGDGTLHDALPTLAETALPFAMLPLGRGNDFARNVGWPSRHLHELLRAEAFGVRRIDLPTVNGRPFGSVACLGFDAAVNALAKEGGGILRGTAGYIVCVLRALGRFRPFRALVSIDGEEWEGDVMMVAVANGPAYGGGMRIAPSALMSDGCLDVCVVRRMSRAALARQFPRVFRGEHVAHEAVSLWRGRRVLIRTEEPRAIWADGEPAGATPAAWEIGERSLRVLMPCRLEARVRA